MYGEVLFILSAGTGCGGASPLLSGFSLTRRPSSEELAYGNLNRKNLEALPSEFVTKLRLAMISTGSETFVHAGGERFSLDSSA
jgi:hypothetical protein